MRARLAAPVAQPPFFSPSVAVIRSGVLLYGLLALPAFPSSRQGNLTSCLVTPLVHQLKIETAPVLSRMNVRKKTASTPSVYSRGRGRGSHQQISVFCQCCTCTEACARAVNRRYHV